MPKTQAQEEFVAFMVDYTAFLQQMRADESTKLEAISSRELERIEHSITVSQANAKQLENFEAKRQAVQQAAGYSGLTFRQLIQQAPAEDQDALWKLFTSFEKTVGEIRFYNDKAMAVARDSMMEIDPDVVITGAGGAKGNNPYEKIREKQAGQNTLLEAKV